MTLRDNLEVDVDSIPYSFDIDLDGNSYTMAISWNPVSRQYLVDTWDSDGNEIYLGEPIVLNQPLWRNVSDTRLPVTPIIPMDESGLETDINPANLGDTVQLCFDDLDGDSE